MADLERCKDMAAILSAPLILFAPSAFRRFLTGLPPVMAILGDSRSHETNFFS
jgi:hypothetical protein